MTKMGVFAVLDVGKTNVDFWVAKPDGTVLETRTIPNHVLGGGGLAPPRSDDTGAMGGYNTGRIMS